MITLAACLVAVWVYWAGILLFQSAAFLWSSRAKTANSLWYTAAAGSVSHFSWFFGQMFIVNQYIRASEAGDLQSMVLAGVFYAFWMVIGTVMAQHILRTYVEKGNRKVGA